MGMLKYFHYGASSLPQPHCVRDSAELLLQFLPQVIVHLYTNKKCVQPGLVRLLSG